GQDSTEACGGDGQGEKREESEQVGGEARGGDGVCAILLERLDAAGGLVGVDLVEALDYRAGDGHGVALCAGHKGGAVLRILREGQINKIGGRLVQAVLVDVAEDADDLCPIFAFVDR